MKGAVIFAVSIAAFVAWASPLPGMRDASGACKPGEKKVGKKTLVVHCGPAKGTVKVGGKTYQIFGGTCGWKPADELYVVDIGIETIGGKPQARYLGIRSPHKRGGTYSNVSVAYQVNGRGNSLGRSTVTISRDLKRGTFSGDALFRSGRATGSWTC